MTCVSRMRYFPIDIRAHIFGCCDGIDIALFREVCKLWKNTIAEKESLLYYDCMKYEHAKEFAFRNFIPRDDWKNLYIIIDQAKVFERRLPIYKKKIEEIEGKATVAKVISLCSLVFTFINVFLGLGNAGIFTGMSKAQFIKNFLQMNPGSSAIDAKTAWLSHIQMLYEQLQNNLITT